jgi:hypothetical protein
MDLYGYLVSESSLMGIACVTGGYAVEDHQGAGHQTEGRHLRVRAEPHQQPVLDEVDYRVGQCAELLFLFL